jgi:hypothetical protein
LIFTFSQNRLRIIKTKLEEASGMKFTIKDFRSTFATYAWIGTPAFYQMFQGR